MLVNYKGLKLDKFQIEALQLLEKGYSVIVCAPTGAGKTLIAEYLLEKELKQGNNIIYTAPIKAINNQKFRDFSKIYPEKVGILTGDVTINPQASCLIMTTEIFRNMVLEKDTRLNTVSYVIFDEIHYMDDRERGTVWEESFIYSPAHIKFLCLSATISNIHILCEWLSTIRQKEFKYILHLQRPVPLKFYIYHQKKFVSIDKEKNKIPHLTSKHYSKKIKKIDELFHLISNLQRTDKLPVIIFIFSRIKTEYLALKISSINFLNESERKIIKETYYTLLRKLNIDRYFLNNLERLIFNGICYHHAGLLPSVKELIEQLFTTGLIKVLFATETFALGVNFPARSIIFPQLYKKQNGKTLPLPKRDFFQMAGRAGRRGIDTTGYIYLLPNPYLPPENLYDFLNSKNIEPINSRFNLNYATILNLYRDLKDDIVDAFEKSFAYFISIKHSPQKTPLKIKENLQNKLKLLKYLKYIDNCELTSKGNFASKLYGYEIFITETFFDNILDRLSSEELAIVFSALIYDSHIKFNHSYKNKIKTIGEIEKKSEEIQKLEKCFNISDSYRGLNFALSKEITIWFKGGQLEDLEQESNIYLGDLIRHFRQILQLCRELLEIVGGYKTFCSKLYEIIIRFNRDEVDAYRQLKQF